MAAATERASRRGPVEHLGRPRRGRAAQGVPPAARRAEPGAGARRVPVRGGRVRGRPAARRATSSWSRRARDSRPSPSPRRSSPTAPTCTSRSPRRWSPGSSRPGEVSLEFATEVAADLGALTAGLHVALASRPDIPELAPRDATRAEIRGWATTARRAPRRGDRRDERRDPDAAARPRAARSPRRSRSSTALPSVPRVIRVHGDLHLGQVLVAPDGYRVIDFEGDPLRDRSRRGAPTARRCATSRRCSARWTTSAGSAGRRAEAQNGGPLEQPGLDLAGWVPRARERFLGAYRDGLREAGEPSAVDAALLRAFEIDKETSGVRLCRDVPAVVALGADRGDPPADGPGRRLTASRRARPGPRRSARWSRGRTACGTRR